MNRRQRREQRRIILLCYLCLLLFKFLHTHGAQVWMDILWAVGNLSAMNLDVNSILGDWPYDPNAVSARWVVVPDGSRKIQMRLDLGILQMEPEGRPDGQRPHGAESLLAHYLAIETKAGNDDFRLEPAACGELQQEAAQYYYRYLSRYALRDLPGVIEDTQHNLDALALVARWSEDDDIVWQFLQFYPYIRMMNARAKAELAAEAHRYEEAVNALDDAIEDIREFWRDNGDEEDEEDSREIEALTQLMGEIRGSTPRTELDKLQEELTRAIAAEHYEKAASLRDAIKALSHL